jgi:hypothetical protein
MEYSEIEQQFYKYIPSWLEQFHNSVFNKERISVEYRKKLIGHADTCIIGELRKKLGLSTDYYHRAGHPNFCFICKSFSNEFMVFFHIIDMKDHYFKILEMLKNHLEFDHGVKL